MNADTRTSIQTVIKTCICIFAAVGVLTTCYWVYGFARLPHVVAPPNSFLIVDIYKSNSYDGTSTRIYFDTPSSPKDVQFEGAELTHEFLGRPHFQASVPLQGFTVAGKGKIVFGSTVLAIDNGSVAVNGEQICPSEITVTRHGTFRGGVIRIAK